MEGEEGKDLAVCVEGGGGDSNGGTGRNREGERDLN